MWTFVRLSRGVLIAGLVMGGVAVEAGVIPEAEVVEVAVNVSEVVAARNGRGDRKFAYVVGSQVEVSLVPWGFAGRAPAVFGAPDNQPSGVAAGMDGFGGAQVAWLFEPFGDGLRSRVEVAVLRPDGSSIGPFAPFADDEFVESAPALASASSGDFAVVAPSGLGTFPPGLALRRFDRAGEAIDPQALVVATTSAPAGFARPSAAWGDKGQLLVVWTTLRCVMGVCSELAVHGQLLDRDGQPTGPRLEIALGGETAKVLWHASGKFLVVWHQLPIEAWVPPDTKPFKVLARTVSPLGELGPIVEIKAGEAGARVPLSVPASATVDAGGNVLVAWQDQAEGPDATQAVKTHLLGPDLGLVGSEVAVPRRDGATFTRPAVAALGPGAFSVGWIEPTEFAEQGLLDRQVFRIARSACVASETQLCLQAGRFAVTGTWRTRGGTTGQMRFRALTGDSATFWFFEPRNVEGLLKVLDGRARNGHFWVFMGTLTNLETRLEVRDLATGNSRVFDNQLGQFASFGNVRAFPASGTGAGLAATAAALDLPVDDVTAEATAACSRTDSAICLLGGRFKVEVVPLSPSGEARNPAGPVELTDNAAAFFFQSRSNLELTVKILDPGDPSGHVWVFWGAATNQRYRLTITDTTTGAVWTRTQTSNSFGSGADLRAFPR